MREAERDPTRCDQALDALSCSVGLAAEAPQIVALFADLCRAANIRHLPAIPRWSGVTDDSTPIEFSIALSRRAPRVRVLVEAQDDPPSPLSYWRAAARVTDLLERHGAHLEAFARVADLFVPTDPDALFAAWHAVEFGGGGEPLFKLYLNLAAQGRGRAPALVREALGRLGFGEAADLILQQCSDKDIPTHLSLDLDSGPSARVKIYMRHFRPTAGDLGRAAGVGGDAAGDFGTVCDLICDSAGPLWQRPLMTCRELNAADRRRPSRTTLYVPLHPYARNDRDAHSRILRLLARFGLEADNYERAYASLAPTRSADGNGFHSYVAFKGAPGGDQLTIYFNLGLFRSEFGNVAIDPLRFWPSAVL